MTSLSEDRLRSALERGLDTPEGKMIQVALFSTAGWGIELTDKRLLRFLRAAADSRPAEPTHDATWSGTNWCCPQHADSRPAELDVEAVTDAIADYYKGVRTTGQRAWQQKLAEHIVARLASTEADQAETPR